MSLNPEWNITCRICLQEGQIRSLFDICPESNLSYCDKVMQCTSVEIRKDDSLPDQICSQCIRDLDVAYRFRVNCESSDAILQSYREVATNGRDGEEVEEDSYSFSSEIQIPISSDVLYSYKPPSGLNVKLVSKEKAVLLENNGEILICAPPEEPTIKDEVQDDEMSGSVGPREVSPEPLFDDDDDNDSLITYDDVLPPSQASQAGDVEEADMDEGEEERSKLMYGLVEGEDSHTVDNESKKPQDDSSADIFFNAELVYVDKEDDILNQLANIKRENDAEAWEIIYDDDVGDSDQYFQKLPQSKASSNETATNTNQPTMNPIKTIQTIRKANIPNEEKPTIENVVTKPGPDGSMETVIRVKRNLKQIKQQHVCKLCNSSYKYKHALETHMRRHRGDKPYKCTECEKAFVVPFELRRHMRIHTGAKPYKCKYCERKFSDFGSKIKHERTHTGERPYVCEVCDKSFTYSHVLNSHMLIHTGVKKYSCPDCDKRFAKSHHLKAHLNIHVRSNSATNSNLNKILPSVDSNTLDNPITNDHDLKLEQSEVSSHVDQLMADSIVDDTRSNDFQLEDPVGGSNPFGQLVNIGDYIISSKNDPSPPTSASSIGAIMDNDDDDDDCGVIHHGMGGGPGGGGVITDDDDPLLKVVTVLTANQMPGMIEGDYTNIRIING
ncbi:myoneurin-like [Ochlerotatus camptorhynchus]|uniref:myoneurin-like n=1 Tax=Ochlerotatus camptorhynchus TaxID=644619 RepID=UPI0031DD0D27